MLIKSGTAINQPTEKGRSALMSVARNGHELCTRVLIGEGAPPAPSI